MNIIALDPGKTTGVAWRTEDGEVRGIEWPGESIVVVLEGFRSVEGIDLLVIEDFLSRPGGPRVSLSAPETIGRIEGWADQYGVPYVRQTPSTGKRMVTNDRLRAAGAWLRAKPHARDAARHLLYREHRLGLLDLEQYPKGD